MSLHTAQKIIPSSLIGAHAMTITISKEHFGQYLLQKSGDTLHLLDGVKMYASYDDVIVEGPKQHDNALQLDGDIFVDELGFAGVRSYGKNTDIILSDLGHIRADIGIERAGAGGSVTNAGLLEAFDKGIELSGTGADVVNTGTITSDRFGIFADQISGVTHVTNKGTVEGEVALFVDGPAKIVNTATGILHAANDVVIIHSHAGDSSLLVNRGVINSDQTNGAIIGGDGNERIINRGEIHGDVSLGDGNDYFDTRGGTFNSAVGGAGDDVYVVSGPVNLTEYAGGGHDLVKSTVSYTLDGFFEDLTLIGHAGATAAGNAAANVLTGNDGANLLLGLQGRDVLTGGAGGDTFVFATGWGKDTVSDFHAGEDHIDLSGWTEVKSLQELKTDHLAVVGDDLVITAGSDVLTIENTQKSDLHAADFIF
jgi:serralysin